MSSRRGHAPDERGRGTAADAIALVRPFVVVVAHEAVESPLQRHATGEVAAAEDDAPELLENRALQAFDEAVGPGMPRFAAAVADAEGSAASAKPPANSPHALDRPAGPLEVGHDDHTRSLYRRWP